MVNNNNTVNQNLNVDGTFISLKDLIRILILGRWIIVLCLFVSLVITTYTTFTNPPKFRSSSTVMIEEKSKSKAMKEFLVKQY